MSPAYGDRIAWRQAVAEVAAKAKATLPQETNGRIEAATKLVLLDEVRVQADGSIEVGSCTDPAKVYHLVGTACDCQDFPRAPGGWCKHRIAAGIAKRVGEVLAESPPVETGPAPVQPLPEAPLPEAAVSITLKGTLHGQDVMVTLRGHDFASVQAQVEQAAVWLQAQAPATPATPQCPIHHVSMKETTKNGSTWISHRTAEGQWCKGK